MAVAGTATAEVAEIGWSDNRPKLLCTAYVMVSWFCEFIR